MNGKVYKIEDNETGEIYIGSTFQNIYKRLSGHRNDCKSYDEGKRKYDLASGNIIRRNNYSVEILQDIICENKDELLFLERQTIDKYGDKCININRTPISTTEEKKIKQKEYIEKNKNKTVESIIAQREIKNIKKKEREAERLVLVEKIMEAHKQAILNSTDEYNCIIGPKNEIIYVAITDIKIPS